MNKKNAKRLAALVMALVMVLSLAACGQKNTTENKPTDSPVNQVEDPQTPTQGSETATEEESQEPTQETPVYAADDNTLISDDNIVFSVKEFVDNEHLGLEMHVYCENKTDKNVIFSLNSVSVCGVMYDPFWAEEVAAGKKVNSVIYFDTFELEEMGITSVDEISFHLSAVDADNWMDEPFADFYYTIYPTGLDAQTVVYPEYRHKNGETVIVDNEQILFIVEKVEDTQSDFYVLNCYLQNRTDRELLISWDNVSVNGFMVDPFWAAAVGARKQMYAQVTFLASDLEEQQIETVTDIAFTLTATDYNSWETVFEIDCEYKPN